MISRKEVEERIKQESPENSAIIKEKQKNYTPHPTQYKNSHNLLPGEDFPGEFRITPTQGHPAYLRIST